MYQGTSSDKGSEQVRAIPIGGYSYGHVQATPSWAAATRNTPALDSGARRSSQQRNSRCSRQVGSGRRIQPNKPAPDHPQESPITQPSSPTAGIPTPTKEAVEGDVEGLPPLSKAAGIQRIPLRSLSKAPTKAANHQGPIQSAIPTANRAYSIGQLSASHKKGRNSPTPRLRCPT